MTDTAGLAVVTPEAVGVAVALRRTASEFVVAPWSDEMHAN